LLSDQVKGLTSGGRDDNKSAFEIYEHHDRLLVASADHDASLLSTDCQFVSIFFAEQGVGVICILTYRGTEFCGKAEFHDCQL
jgi:hypothetical protein